MNPISKLTRTLSVLRQDGKPRTGAATAQSQRRGSANAPAAPEASAQQLRTEIAKRLRAIARDDPNRRNASIRVFVERVLVHELGSQLQSSPKFPGLVADVQQAMESDDGVKAELEALLLELDAR